MPHMHSSHWKNVFLSLGVVAAAMVSVALPTPLVAQTKKPNIVVFVLDQLRADQLHCYGNPRETSPNIDRLASRGTLFTTFNTVTPWTSPSFSSLYTSLYPSKHGVTLFWRPGMPLLNKDTPLLAENLQNAGYYTAAFVDNSLGGYPINGSGFDEYYKGGRPAVDITIRSGSRGNELGPDPATVAHVLQWLDTHHNESQPFFLYVHFIDPHSPYNPPPQDDIFKSDAYPYLTNTGYDMVRGALFRLAMTGDQKAIDRLYQLYDGKIHYIDRYVGEILARLKSMGLDENTYVLLTSDHGEMLYSHPKDFLTFDHRSLYNPVLHIPLIVVGPEIPASKRIDALASNIDTAPTILALAGAQPLSDAEGHSLVPLIQGKVSSVNPYLFAEEDVEIPERSVRTNRYKLIRNLWTEQEQLFDMQTDPGELHDISKENPAVVKQLHEQLDGWMRVNEPSPTIQRRRWKIYTQDEKVVTIDDMTTGAKFLLSDRTAWHSDASAASGNYEGGSFWTEGGDGSRTAIWRGDNPLVGTYKVSVYVGRPPVGKLATNASYKVVTAEGSKTMTLDLQQNAGQWRPLGTFHNPRYVQLSNAADGVVVADAVRFERINP